MRALLLIALLACGSSKKPGAACDSPGGRVCVGEDVVACGADKTLGDKVQSCKGLCNRGACTESCALKDNELIYVVDRDNTLSSFDPAKLPGDDAFRKIAKLTCDPKSHPFSMAIDREGIAWVLYQTGALYRVSIIDGHCSSKPAWKAGGTFGMGFVNDASGEKLFLVDSAGDHALSEVDVGRDPPVPRTIAAKLAVAARQNPELTGTGDGKLYGYFPEYGHGFVQEIDRGTAQPVGEPIKLDMPKGNISAWAFAHWGGVFYVFVTFPLATNLYAVPRNGGPTTVVREGLSAITGAGVSTCAPLLEKR